MALVSVSKRKRDWLDEPQGQRVLVGANSMKPGAVAKSDPESHQNGAFASSNLGADSDVLVNKTRELFNESN